MTRRQVPIEISLQDIKEKALDVLSGSSLVQFKTALTGIFVNQQLIIQLARLGRTRQGRCQSRTRLELFRVNLLCLCAAGLNREGRRERNLMEKHTDFETKSESGVPACLKAR